MTTATKPTPAEICAAYDAECAARRKYWIGGHPTQADLRVVRQAVSRALKVEIERVSEALRDRRAAEDKAAKHAAKRADPTRDFRTQPIASRPETAPPPKPKG